jgi:hypothetical protein
MGKQVIAAATAIVLGTIPTYSMAAGTDMHEMEDTAPSPAAAAVASEVLPPTRPFWGRGVHRRYEPRRERAVGNGHF